MKYDLKGCIVKAQGKKDSLFAYDDDTPVTYKFS